MISVQRDLEQKEIEVLNQNDALQQKLSVIRQKDEEICDRIKEKEAILQQKDAELKSKDEEICRMAARISTKNAELKYKEECFGKNISELKERDSQLSSMERKLQQLQVNSSMLNVYLK